MRENGRRVFMAGGGTGGHLYPGLAIAEALRRIDPDTAVAFSCTRREIDRKVLAGTGYPATPTDAKPFRRTPWSWPSFLVSLFVAGNQVRRRFHEFCPDVVVGLGGFGSYSPVRVGRKYGLATVILNPDIVPGRANRALAKRVDAVFCQFDETAAEFGPIARATGCPVRPSLLGRKRADGAAAFGLDPAKRTLLVTGASLGARTINRSMVSLMKEGGLPAGWQVLHLAGHGEYEEVAAAYKAMAAPAVVRPYADDMGLAYAAADLAVARAGASSVAEIMAVGLPAIFLPYPFHKDQHQLHQARAIEAKGAALVVEDQPDDPTTWMRLGEALAALMNDASRLDAMRQEARAASKPHAAEEIAQAILKLADRMVERRHAAILSGVDKPPQAA
jgi:UDP-N-acetylglucosamine--N-acetylmuramyl-(pentapeptide) pyrophosphoryl-undecaprenol N-acetylglucosamine transferase